ncbi:hypothetical protein [Streptomyces sp. x-80]|uniref:hypothetical protein n=1 Tax=Streptomyces sp. x-80 TaxID=2789282 RepID=UPI00397ECB8F
MSSSPSCEPEESEAACAVSPFFCPAHYLEGSHLSKSAAQLAADVAAAVREISYSTVEPAALRYPPQVSGLVQPFAAPADQLPHVLGRLRAAVRRRGAAGRIRRGDGTGPGPAAEVPNGQGPEHHVMTPDACFTWDHRQPGGGHH